VATLDLSNGTLLPGNFLTANGIDPNGLTLDPANGEVYVTCDLSNSVLVVNEFTGTVVGAISVSPQSYPNAVAYDPVNGYLYVVDGDVPLSTVRGLSQGQFGPYAHGNVTVIDGADQTIVTTIPTGSDPDGLAFDNATGDFYVTNWGSDNLTVINATTDQAVGAIGAGGLWPNNVVYDPKNGDLYVDNAGSLPTASPTGALATIDPVTGKLVSSLQVGPYPYGLVYDPANEDVYVESASALFVVSTATNAVVTTIPGAGGVGGVALDPATGSLYVAPLTQNNLTVVNGTTNKVVGSVPVGWGPSAVTYDAAHQEVWVGNLVSDNLTVVNATTGLVTGSIRVGVYPSAAAFGGVNLCVYVAEFDANTVVEAACQRFAPGISPALAVGVGPVALAPNDPDGTVFAENEASNTVSVLGQVFTSVYATVTVGSQPSGAVADGRNGDVYVADFGSGNLTVVNGSSNTEIYRTVGSVALGSGAAPYAVAYDPANGLLYVAESNVLGTLTVVNGSTNAIVGTIPVGSMPTAVAYDGAAGTIVVANTGSDNVSIVSAATGVVLRSVPVGGGPDAIDYDASNGYLYVANFASDNLTVLNGTTDAAVGSIPVGVGPDGVTDSTATGEVYVTNAISGSVSIVGATPVRFVPAGSPHGKAWTVVLGGVAQTAVGPISYVVPPGNLSYLVTGPHGWRVQGVPLGVVDVGAKPIVQTVNFVKGSTPSVRFNEHGLPTGQSWCVTLGSWSQCSTVSSVSYAGLTPATYGYAVQRLLGQTISASLGGKAIPLSGNLTVAGSGVKVALYYVYPYALTFIQSGAPAHTWSVTIHGLTESNLTGGPIVFHLPNGTYRYKVSPEPGLKAVGVPSPATVHGGPASVTVTYEEE